MGADERAGAVGGGCATSAPTEQPGRALTELSAAGTWVMIEGGAAHADLEVDEVDVTERIEQQLKSNRIVLFCGHARLPEGGFRPRHPERARLRRESPRSTSSRIPSGAKRLNAIDWTKYPQLTSTASWRRLAYQEMSRSVELKRSSGAPPSDTLGSHSRRAPAGGLSDRSRIMGRVPRSKGNPRAPPPSNGSGHTAQKSSAKSVASR